MLKRLLDVLRQPKATSGDLTPALKEARHEATAAETARAAAARAYQDGLLTLDEAALAKLVVDQQADAIRRDRANALVAALEAKLAEAEGKEAEAARQRRRSAAVKAAEAAAKSLETYPGLARQIVTVLTQLAEAEMLVMVANADLPAGAEPVLSPELLVRGLPPVPRKELRTEIESDVWYYVGGEWDGTEVERELQQACKPNYPLGRAGTLERKFEAGGRRKVRVAKRRLQRRWFLQRHAAYIPNGLASEVCLPGLEAGAPVVWEPVGGGRIVGPPASAAEEVIAAAAAVQQAKHTGDPRFGLLAEQSTYELLDEPDLSSVEPDDVAA